MKNLFLIGGPMGVGKTTVCRILKNILNNSVLLDGDNLWDMHPFIVDDSTKSCVIGNIAACLTNFINCQQFKNIIFCWVMNKREIIDNILEKLPCGDIKIINISLICGGQTLIGRLQNDISRGVRAADVITRSLSYLPDYAALNTIKINTDGLSPAEIAEKIKAVN